VIGSITALAFVRLIGMALLGEPRSEASMRAHESPLSMTAPIAVLVALCAALGVIPAVLVGPLGRVAARVSGGGVPALDAALLWRIGIANLGTWTVIGLVTLLYVAVRRDQVTAIESTWGCGYAAPTARMQYTASSFAQLAVRRLLPARLSARITRSESAAFLPSVARFETDCEDPLTRGVYEPFFDRWARRFSRLRWMQQGALHAYLVYILVMVVLGLGWVSVRAWVHA